ncbi:hypothetical protein FISHEDRAFT_67536 [Fistulina hepatica ATCC 64428]|uniref:Phospholipid/glycerol acyltransferase domain-containing protein n=1 Tax=Fistulina hepatica ATCC 64428 TaxID=1128425 RepID=A0A0D7A073_9AGAR|nr:hypothetical protein FISHEDRAFT_67536 [Fistulina hepatica ATCC 64428]
MKRRTGSDPTWSYIFIRWLFKFVLKIFYGTIVVENACLIPPDGCSCIVSANHSNSLTDAFCDVIVCISQRRKLLRLTAKSTQFGRRTFTSWLIENAGTVPIMRPKDFPDGKVDNTEIMKKLAEALDMGDAVCMFPEGMSRYHPRIAPMKTGIARLVSDVLTKNQDDPNFEIYVLTCSITYMHRQHFRSDVLVTFHRPFVLRPQDNPELIAPVDYSAIKSLMTEIHDSISSGALDAPKWDLYRSAKLAARIYAPLGTQMSLGDHVRVTHEFLEAFKEARPERNSLHDDLRVYQDQLVKWGIKDDRIIRPLSRHIISYRIVIRFIWASILTTLSAPGLMLWLPIFITTYIAVRNFTKTGPIFDTWDEIAQYKLVYGLVSGVCVWLGATLLTLPVAPVTFFLIPVLMWMSLRWFEDAVSSFRAFLSLLRLLRVGKPALKDMAAKRASLHTRIMALANEIGLPAEPEVHFIGSGGKEKGRVVGPWQSSTKYFSLRRRRKRDWNETLRLYDKVDYPVDDSQ